ncbi:MAG TPA: hypothetical protein VF070_02325 [Streptosporangiaceae bacterium]
MSVPALLAIDPPKAWPSGRRLPLPCQILDWQLRPVAQTVANGELQTLPSGQLVVVLHTAEGVLTRTAINLEPGRRYRLRYQQPIDLGLTHGWNVSVSADEEILRIIRFLEMGNLAEARLLADTVMPRVLAKDVDPVAAAAVGYVLVQQRDCKALAPWCLDLPHDHPWLSDAFVIAADYHAFTGNDLTALNYLRQLDHLNLPVFNLGLFRALERLAGYKGLSVEAPPTSRAQAAERTEFPSAQLLDIWDVKEAGALRDRLAERAINSGLPDLRLTASGVAPWAMGDVREAYSTAGGLRIIMNTPVSGEANAMADTATPTNKTTSEKRTGISGIPMIVAVAAILVWVGFIIAMALSTNASDNQWTRLVYVFGSVEAIAFAAAGALFGVTVQRDRVEKAEKVAEQNAQDAASGRALAAVNLADEGQIVQRDGGSVFESYGPDDAKDAEIRRRHATAARRLFPDL